MRFPRFVLLVLGFLLIGMIGVSVSYLHHLMYPDALSKNDLARALTPPRVELRTPRIEVRLEAKRIGDVALSPLDQPIDELGAHVQTEDDAKAYVEALWKRWCYNPNETYPHLAEFQEQLARAEFAAVRDPRKLIPESRVVKTFNKLMDEWQMPSWTRISVSELHAFRFTAATTTYPRSVVRLPDQTIAPSCRPTEAVLLIFLLDNDAPMLPEYREQVRNGRFPWSLLKQMKELVSKPERSAEFPPRTPPERERREAQYMACRDKHFASHPVSFENVVNDVFGQLGIPQNVSSGGIAGP